MTETVRISDGLLREAVDGIAAQAASDNRLTLAAQGTMARLLGQLALVELDASLLAASPCDDAEAIESALRELEKAGYVSTARILAERRPVA